MAFSPIEPSENSGYLVQEDGTKILQEDGYGLLMPWAWDATAETIAGYADASEHPAVYNQLDPTSSTYQESAPTETTYTVSDPH